MDAFQDSEFTDVEWLRDETTEGKASTAATWAALVLFCFAPALAFVLFQGLVRP